MSEIKSAIENLRSSFSNLYKLVLNKLYQKSRQYPYIALGIVGSLILSVSAYALLKEDVYTKEELIDVLQNDVFKTCDGNMSNINEPGVAFTLGLSNAVIPKYDNEGYIAFINFDNCALSKKLKSSIYILDNLIEINIKSNHNNLEFISNLKSLQIVHLEEAEIFDYSHLFLLRNISYLNLKNSNFPKEDRDKLRAALPNTKIVF